MILDQAKPPKKPLTKRQRLLEVFREWSKSPLSKGRRLRVMDEMRDFELTARLHILGDRLPEPAANVPTTNPATNGA